MQLSDKSIKLSGNIIVASMAFVSSIAVAATGTQIDQRPLTGVNVDYGANVMITPSIEFPTAGPAYQNTSITEASELGKTYLGYFDPQKCYTYSSDIYKPEFFEKHKQFSPNIFEPSSPAETKEIIGADGKKYTIVGACDPKLGNQFSGNMLNRFTMSALDIFRKAMTGGNRMIDDKNISLFFPSGKTVLRRANVDVSTEGKRGYWCPRYSQGDGLYISLPNKFLQYLFPRKFLETGDDNHNTTISFYNSGFNALIVRGRAEVGCVKPETNSGIEFKQYQIAVNVCNKRLGALEENCQEYPNGNFKPVGIIQKMSRMRFGVASYLFDIAANDTQSEQNRAKKHLITAVRAQMRNITTGIQGGVSEINSETGQYILDPDKMSDSNQNIKNSGVINFINKFGDNSGYMEYDHGAELFYTALRYFRHGGRDALGQPNGLAPYNPPVPPISNSMLDGFPAIYKWDDPLKSGSLSKSPIDQRKQMREQICRNNVIVFLGDTHTWADTALPHFGLGNANEPTDDDIQTKDSLEKIFAHEQNPHWTVWNQQGFGVDDRNVSGTYSPAGLAALAYWGNTHDNRPDIEGNQKIQSFFIDVVENNEYRNGFNSFYYAGKYGNFTDKNGNDFPDLREEWTDDKLGKTSIDQFIDGVPRGFSIANKPDLMVKALKDTFKRISAAKHAVQQSRLGLNIAPDTVLDINNHPLVLKAVFDGADWTGDVIAYPVQKTGGVGKALWSASDLLDSQYFDGTTRYLRRNIFTLDKRFAPENAEELSQYLSLPNNSTYNSKDLIHYVMGKQSEAVNSLRVRKKLLGAVVNSSVTPILHSKSTKHPLKCNFYDETEVLNQPITYAFAANDGMLHIINNTGSEIAAYIPSTDLTYLKKYADPQYQFFYMNDTTPVVKNVCDIYGDQHAHTILVGSTGRSESKTVYALDVTKMDGIGPHSFKWEYHSEHLGQTTGEPVITKDSDGRAIVVLSSGYNNEDRSGHIIILDAITGHERQVINLGDSGVGAVFVEEDDSGKAIRIFAGDQSGKLWQVNNDKSTHSWSVAYDGKPLFTPSVAYARPIYAAPRVQVVQGKVFVTFGTGRYLTTKDINTVDINYGYGLFVGNADGPITENQLIQQQVEESNSKAISQDGKPPLTIYKSTVLNKNEQKDVKGWRVRLLPGQNIASQPAIIESRLVQFTAVRENDKQLSCSVSGSTAILVVDLQNGSMLNRPVFDTNGDGKINGDDKVGSMIEVGETIIPNSNYIKTTNSNFIVLGDHWIKIIHFPTDSNMIRVNYREIKL